MPNDDGAYTIRVVYPPQPYGRSPVRRWVAEPGVTWTDIPEHAGVFPRKVAEDLAGYWRSHGWTVRLVSVD
jgi:hypothetical protein